MSDKDMNDLTSEIFSQIDKDDESLSDESENNDEEKIKISKEFQENVVKFVKLDDLIQKKQEELSELKQQKKPCEEYIIKYLDGIKTDVIQITNGTIKKNKSESKASINSDLVKKTISQKITDPLLLDAIMKELELARQTSIKVNLKRTGSKVKRNKKK
jgi:L-cysteine desulfidase